MTLRTLHYHQQRRILDLIFSDGTVKALSAEFLRVHSPSAEVRGHGKPTLVANNVMSLSEKLPPQATTGLN